MTAGSPFVSAPGVPVVPCANLAPNPHQHQGVGATFRQRVIEPRTSCTVNGCTKTFRRPGDFRRHLKKHQAPTLRCFVEDCDMKFYRMDKLRDHARRHQIVL
jgi:hypothetical protein